MNTGNQTAPASPRLSGGAELSFLEEQDRRLQAFHASIARSILPALSFVSFGLVTSGASVSEMPGGTGLNNAANPPAALVSPPPGGRTAFDFDADGRADVAVWRPATGDWLVIQSSNSTVISMQLGASGDRIVPADYDNDNHTDHAVYTPSSGRWSIRKSATGETVRTFWGLAGDIPVPGDYDGDGFADLAVWRPSDGNWYIWHSSTGSYYAVLFGNASLGDTPVAGDYDGDGVTDIAVHRASTAEWYVRRSSDEVITGLQWGLSTDIAAPADYDGDGRTDYAVWRDSGNPAAAGEWYVYTSSRGAVLYSQFGASSPADVLAPADYGGDGIADFAVWRPSSGYWYIWQSESWGGGL